MRLEEAGGKPFFARMRRVAGWTKYDDRWRLELPAATIATRLD
jgi:hypothetical protein